MIDALFKVLQANGANNKSVDFMNKLRGGVPGSQYVTPFSAAEMNSAKDNVAHWLANTFATPVGK